MNPLIALIAATTGLLMMIIVLVAVLYTPLALVGFGPVLLGIAKVITAINGSSK